jgi:hypothetical protein
VVRVDDDFWKMRYHSERKSSFNVQTARMKHLKFFPQRQVFYAVRISTQAVRFIKYHVVVSVIECWNDLYFVRTLKSLNDVIKGTLRWSKQHVTWFVYYMHKVLFGLRGHEAPLDTAGY